MRNNFDEPHVHPLLETQAGVWVYDTHFNELVWVSRGRRYEHALGNPDNRYKLDPAGYGISPSISDVRILACKLEAQRPSANSAPFQLPAPVPARIRRARGEV